MGGGQSTRKIGIDNDDTPVGVIRVSENVAQRLKVINNGGGHNNPPKQSFSNPHPEGSVSTSIPTFQQPTGAMYAPQQFITSSMIREEIEKELEKNDRYWERRVKSLQDNQNRISHIMEGEFKKAYKEIETNFPTLAPKDKSAPCQDYKSLVVDCFKNNANHTLNCKDVVNQFTSCINNYRSSGPRSP